MLQRVTALCVVLFPPCCDRVITTTRMVSAGDFEGHYQGE